MLKMTRSSHSVRRSAAQTALAVLAALVASVAAQPVVPSCVVQGVDTPAALLDAAVLLASPSQCLEINITDSAFSGLAPFGFTDNGANPAVTRIVLRNVTFTNQTAWSTAVELGGLTALRELDLLDIVSPPAFAWQGSGALAAASPNFAVLTVTGWPQLSSLPPLLLSGARYLEAVTVTGTNISALPAQFVEYPVLASNATVVQTPSSGGRVLAVDLTGNPFATADAAACEATRDALGRQTAMLSLLYNRTQPAWWLPATPVCTAVADVNECGTSTNPWVPNDNDDPCSLNTLCQNLVSPLYPPRPYVNYRCSTSVCRVSGQSVTAPLSRAAVAATIPPAGCHTFTVASSSFRAAWRVTTLANGSVAQVWTAIDPDAFLDLAPNSIQLLMSRVTLSYGTSTAPPVVSNATSAFPALLPPGLLRPFRQLQFMSSAITTDFPVLNLERSDVTSSVHNLTSFSTRLTAPAHMMPPTFMDDVAAANPQLASMVFDTGTQNLLMFAGQGARTLRSREVSLQWTFQPLDTYNWTYCDAAVVALAQDVPAALPVELQPYRSGWNRLVLGDAFTTPRGALGSISVKRACTIWPNANQCGARNAADAVAAAWASAPAADTARVEAAPFASACNVTGAAGVALGDGTALLWGGVNDAAPQASSACASTPRYWDTRARRLRSARVVGAQLRARSYAAAVFIPTVNGTAIIGGLEAGSTQPATTALLLISQTKVTPDPAFLTTQAAPLATFVSTLAPADNVTSLAPLARVGASAVFDPLTSSVLVFGGAPNMSCAFQWPANTTLVSYNGTQPPCSYYGDILSLQAPQWSLTTVSAAAYPQQGGLPNITADGFQIPLGARAFHAAAYDAASGCMFVHGGEAWVDTGSTPVNESDPDTWQREWVYSVLGDIGIFCAYNASWVSPPPGTASSFNVHYDHGVYGLRRTRHAAAVDGTSGKVYLVGGMGFPDAPYQGDGLGPNPNGIDAWRNRGRSLVLMRDMLVFDLVKQAWDRPSAIQRALGLLPGGGAITAVLSGAALARVAGSATSPPPGDDTQGGLTRLSAAGWFVGTTLVVAEGAVAGVSPSRAVVTISEGSLPCMHAAGFACTDADDWLAANETQMASCRCPNNGPVYTTVAPEGNLSSCLTCPLCPDGYYSVSGCEPVDDSASSYLMQCAPWSVCNATIAYALNTPNATHDRFCKSFDGPAVPICDPFALAPVPPPGTLPSKMACWRPTTSPLFAWPLMVDARPYPVGRTYGDICQATCASSQLPMGPSTYVCNINGTWLPAVARVSPSGPAIWPVPAGTSTDGRFFETDASAVLQLGEPQLYCFSAVPPAPGAIRLSACDSSILATAALAPPLSTTQLLLSLLTTPWSTSPEAVAQASLVLNVARHAAAAYQFVVFAAPASATPVQLQLLGQMPQLNTTLPLVGVSSTMLQVGSVSSSFSAQRAVDRLAYTSMQGLRVAAVAIGHTGARSNVGDSFVLSSLFWSTSGWQPLPTGCTTITPLPDGGNIAVPDGERPVVSDSLAPAMLTFQLGRPLAAEETVVASCAAAAGSGIILQPSVQTVSPLSPRFTVNASLVFSPSLTTSASNLSAVTCQLQSSYMPTDVVAGFRALPANSTATIQVGIIRTLWPLFSDAVLELPGESSLRSSWSSVQIPIPAGIIVNGMLGNTSSPTTAAAQNDTLIIAMVMQVARRPLPGQNFQVTVSGALNLTLVADGTMPRFGPNTAVFMGGVPCTIRSIEAAGTLMSITTPRYADVCTTGSFSGGDCGFQRLDIVNRPPTPDPVLSLATAADAQVAAGAVNRTGAAISCPPFCPSADLDGALTYATGVYPNVVIGRTTAPGTALQGVYYIKECVGAFPNPATGICTNASDSRSALCAFGYGDLCTPCGQGGLCPGGQRMHPLPGWWGPSEAFHIVARCLPPATERCLGWSDDLRTSACGPAYAQASYACSGCSAGHYEAADGSCAVCPEANFVNAVLPIIYFVGGLSVVGLFMLTVIKLTQTVTVVAAAKQVASFCVSAWVSMQTVVQVTRTVAPALPSFMQSMNAVFARLQWQGVSMPPACTSAPAFQEQTILFSIVAAAGVLLVVLNINYRRLCGCYACGVGRHGAPVKGAAGQQGSARKLGTANSCVRAGRAFDVAKPGLRKFMFALLTVLYAVITNAALQVVDCDTVPLSVRNYLSLDGDGSTLRALGRRDTFDPACIAAICNDVLQNVELADVISVRVLTSNPAYICYESVHRSIGISAWVVLAVFSVAYPLLSALFVSQRVRKIMAKSASAETYAVALKADAARRFEFLHGRRPGRSQCTRYTWLLCCDTARLPRPSLSRLPSTPSTSSAVIATAASAPRRPVSMDAGKASSPIVDLSRRSPVLRPPPFTLELATIPAAPLSPGAATSVAAQPSPTSPSRSSGPDSMRSDSMQHFALVDALKRRPMSPQMRPRTVPGATSNEVMDAESRLTTDATISYFTANDYRPSKHAFRQLDMFTLLLLSVILVFWRQPTNALSAIFRGFVTILVVGVQAALLIGHRPFRANQTWKFIVKLYVVALSIVASISNVTAFLYANRDVSRPTPFLLQATSVLAFASCCGLFLVLIISFLYSAYQQRSPDAPCLRGCNKTVDHHSTTMSPLAVPRRQSTAFRALSQFRGAGAAPASAPSSSSRSPGSPAAAALPQAASRRVMRPSVFAGRADALPPGLNSPAAAGAASGPRSSMAMPSSRTAIQVLNDRGASKVDFAQMRLRSMGTWELAAATASTVQRSSPAADKA